MSRSKLRRLTAVTIVLILGSVAACGSVSSDGSDGKSNADDTALRQLLPKGVQKPDVFTVAVDASSDPLSARSTKIEGINADLANAIDSVFDEATVNHALF